MFFSLKPQPSFDLFPSLYISNCLLERVYSYKYLGLILTCSLSWSSHISSIKKRSKKILGLIYRHFYPHSSTPVLLSLYKTIVRPILEYASAVWDPNSSSLTASIESVQHFAVMHFLVLVLPLFHSSVCTESGYTQTQKEKIWTNIYWIISKMFNTELCESMFWKVVEREKIPENIYYSSKSTTVSLM